MEKQYKNKESETIGKKKEVKKVVKPTQKKKWYILW